MTVTWDEPITFGTGGGAAALGVYAPSGRRIDSRNVRHPAPGVLSVSLPTRLAHGTYTVGWKVTSADTHVVHGAFTFSIGAPSAGGGIARRLLAAEDIPVALADGFALVRFLNLLLVALCVGGAACMVVVLRDGAPAVRRPLWGGLVACGVLLALAALLGLPFEAAEQNGTSLWGGFGAAALAGVRHMRFGEAWITRAWLALLTAALAMSLQHWPRARRRSREVLLAVAVTVLALTPSASGHASVAGALTFLIDALHVVCAGAWGGGLVFLSAGLAAAPRAGRWALAARAVPRFSALALGSVAVLLATGAVNAYLEVRSFAGLVDSTYGALVLAKGALALPLLALGAFNNRVGVPALRADVGAPAARRRFVRAIGAELLVFVAVIGVTAVLVGEAPAKGLGARPAGPFTTRTSIGPYALTLRVTPAATGANTVTIRIADRRGNPPRLAAVTIAAAPAVPLDRTPRLQRPAARTGALRRAPRTVRDRRQLAVADRRAPGPVQRVAAHGGRPDRSVISLLPTTKGMP